MNNKIKGTVVISKDAKELTTDILVRCIFGKSFDSFVNEIKENKNGKYDFLYVSEV